MCDLPRLARRAPVGEGPADVGELVCSLGAIIAGSFVALVAGEKSVAIERVGVRVDAGVTHQRILRDADDVAGGHEGTVGESEGLQGLALHRNCFCLPRIIVSPGKTMERTAGKMRRPSLIIMRIKAKKRRSMEEE